MIRRYERAAHGDFVHVEIKKLGRIPDDGGWKVLGRQAGIKNNSGHGPRRVGYGYIQVLADNGSCYRSRLLNDTLGEITHGFTRPYRPQTNGKVERLPPSLQSPPRHKALGGQPPITRVNELPGTYS